MADSFVNSFLLYFVMLDPLGMIPIFLAVTHGCSDKERSAIARSAVAYSVVLFIFFATVGWPLFSALGISAPAIGLGGGTLLFIFSLEMLFEKRQERRSKEGKMQAGSLHLAVFPLATPLIVGPGAIIALFLNRVEVDSVISLSSLLDLSAAFLVLICILLGMIFAVKIKQVLGDRVIVLVSRLMGLVLAIFATQIALNALRDFISQI